MSTSHKSEYPAEDYGDREAHETRAQGVREAVYTPPDYLQIPAALVQREKSQGNILRWIRISVVNEPDLKNVSQRKSEGFEFVTIDQAPEFDGLAEVIENPKMGRMITVGDLALARIPLAKAKARQRFYEEAGQTRMRAVRQELQRNSTREYPIFDDSSSRTTRGRDVDFG